MYIVNVCWDASQKDINVLQYGSTVNVITGDVECNSPMFGIFLTPLTLSIQCQPSLKYRRTTEQPIITANKYSSRLVYLVPYCDLTPLCSLLLGSVAR